MKQVFETIISPQNPLLREVRRAARRGTLTSGGYCLVETFRLLEDAVRSQREVRAVLLTRSAAEDFLRQYGPVAVGPVRIAVVADTIFKGMASTEAPQGVLALVKAPAWTWRDVLAGNPLTVILDGVQDPGNAGAMVRAAEAFGASGVVFLKGSVSPWNPKTVRASAGSLFRLPVVCAAREEAVRALQERGVRIYAASARRGCDATSVRWREPAALVIGNEGRGLAEGWETAEPVRIGTRGVESLNAALAAGILLYEARRQRGWPAGG